ncbi:MAG: MFS transporter [Deltaproteobacteria bacterium]|nr:MFS transporter [Deltaproteobacteria bacterium]
MGLPTHPQGPPSAVPPRSAPWVHYAWVIVAVTFLALITAAAVRSAPGVFIVPLEREFGWTRATISVSLSVNLLLYGLIGPFAAGLLEEIGVKRTMAGALGLLALSVGLTAAISKPWHMLVLWGFAVGCSAGMITTTLSAILVNRWFVRDRGIVLGILTSSMAAGQLIFLPVLALMTERYGWRAAVYTMVATLLAAIPMVLFLMRDRPADVGLRPYGDDGEAPPVPAAAATGNFVRTALSGLALGVRSPDFWLLGGSFFVCGATTNGLIGTHLIPACIDNGIPEVRAAGMVALMGVLNLVGTNLSGWLSDRFNNRYLLCWYYGLRGLSLLGLPYALTESSMSLSVFAVIYGLDWIATVPPTVRLTADIFGRERVGVAYGWIFALHQVGAALAAVGAGTVRTCLGEYVVAFLAGGALCLLAALFVLRIGKTARSRAEIRAVGAAE